MFSKLVIMERSTLPHKVNVTPLTDDIVRRLKNTGREVGKEDREEILSTMMEKMVRSGYSETDKGEKLKEEEDGGKKLIYPDGRGNRRGGTKGQLER